MLGDFFPDVYWYFTPNYNGDYPTSMYLVENFRIETPGWMARVLIYDLQVQFVKVFIGDFSHKCLTEFLCSQATTWVISEGLDRLAYLIFAFVIIPARARLRHSPLLPGRLLRLPQLCPSQGIHRPIRRG